jgi:carbamoyl-phosphate synthase/aspartate carbamoyltransferase
VQFGVDTRMLTKKIREHGTMLGAIEFASQPVALQDPNSRNLVAEVSRKVPQVFNKGATPRIMAYDCGMKFNIIRFLLSKGMELTVVPYNHDCKPDYDNVDGFFFSNGPGDPAMATDTIETMKWIMGKDKPKPVFGICLGNQLMAIAAGAKTFKMKYGNRSMNQPCIDMRTMRCYITPQNHGYAVDSDSLTDGWKTLFVNANDQTNEGIIHRTKPFFSAQFHPEACGGPMDTSFLFDTFLEQVSGAPQKITTMEHSLFSRKRYRKVLVLGSGGLSIGQAGEFDYSGSQAIKALKEESLEVVLVNPNIATVQTSSGLADKVYFLPVLAPTVAQIIEKEQPDCIVVSMGGQTALNVGIVLHETGVLKKHNVEVIGTQIDVIISTEDREVFAEKLKEIDEVCALSYPATTVEQAKEAAAKIGYPVLVRAAFALGGLGSGFANNEPELVNLVRKAFASSDQVGIVICRV